MAKPRRANQVALLGVVRRRRSYLLLTTALQASVGLVLSLPAVSQPAPNARPTGGAVVAGAASINQTQNNTAITQSSQRAAVNWQSFDVGAQQSVTFHQPSASAVVLNRVVGPNPSQIAGRIDANGQVILTNQSGVTFYKGAQVNTNGLMVTAAGISNQNFMAGGALTFDQPAKPNARVENQGTITIRQAGLAALVAPQVANSGVINAKLGHVVLAGAKTATLDLYGDGLLSLDVTNQVTQAPVGPDGKPVTALVTNTGVIVADGGTVQLTARAADGVVQNLVQAGGKIRAATIGTQTGTVALNGVGGSIVVEGQLSAPGLAPGTTGGAVEIATTGNVTVASGARINASGKAGGGVVAIGTNLARAKGGPSVTTSVVASNVTVQPGATIAANGIAKGNGGRVTVLSSDTTHMDGLIQAKGGRTGGDGGFVEVSGDNLGITGSIDVSAPAGTMGTVLLDPDFLTIVAGSAGSGDQNPTFVANGGSVLASDPPIGADTVSNGVINAFAGNVLLQANNTLTVAAPISLTSHPGQQLTLEAGGTVTVNTGISVTASGDVTIATGGAGPDGPPAAQPSPLISLLGSVSSTGGSVNLLAGEGGTVNIGATGLVSAASGRRVTVQTDTLTVAAGAKIAAPAGTIELAPASAIAMHLGGAGGLSISQATLNALSTGMLRLGGATVDDVLTQTASSISIDGPLNLSSIATTLDLQSTGGVSETGSLSNVGTLTGKTGSVALTAGLDSIANIGNYTVIGGGNFSVALKSGVIVGGTISTSGTTGIIANSITLAGAANVQGTAITLNSATDIALIGAASLGQAGATLDLTTGGGNIAEANTARITAGTLQSSDSVAGTVSLLGTNSVASIANFAITGDFLLRDTASLTVAGALTAPAGNIYLQTANAGGITVAGGGTVAAGGSKLASFETDTFISDAKATVAAGMIELAPNTSGMTFALGSGGNVTSLAGLDSVNLRIGAVTDPVLGLIKTAVNISIVGNFGNPTTNLELDTQSGGTISNLVGSTLTAATLTGSTGSVALTKADITTVSSFITTGSAGFSLDDAGFAGNLNVAGPVTAATGPISITNAPTLTVSGSIEAAGAVTLASGPGGIALDTGAIVTGSMIAFDGNAGGIALSGNAALGDSGALIDLTTTGDVTEAATSVITGATLQSTKGVTGTVDLAGTANAIANLANFVVTNGDFSLTDSDALTLNGALSANNVTLNAPQLTAAGSVTAANTLSLSATKDGILLNGSATLNAPSIDLAASGSGVTEAATAQIVAGMLQAPTGIIGAVNLAGTANAIANLGTFAVSGGSFALTNSGSLNVIGDVSGSNVIITTIGTGPIDVTAAISAPGGTIALNADGVSIGSGGAVSNAALIDIDGGSGGISLTGTGKIGTAGAGIVDLSTTGGIAETANETVDAATLRSTKSVTGSFDLSAGSNDILNLGSIAVSGGGAFDLNDSGNPGALSVTGPLTASNVQITGVPTLMVGGSIGAATSLSLIGGTIALGNGALLTGTMIDLASGSGGIALSGNAVLGNSGAMVALSTTGGGITETGTSAIIAATLQSRLGVTGTTTLDRAGNDIVALGSFAVSGGDFTLADNGNPGNLAISGPVTATTVIIGNANTGTISVSGGIAATTQLSLTSGSGGIALGSGALLTGATIDLNGNTGGIALTGDATIGNTGALVDITTTGGGVAEAPTSAIIAATVQSPSSVSGAVNLAGTANAIANLGSFAVSGGSFTLDDSVGLNVIGGVSGSNVSITAPGTGQIDVTAAISASGGTIALTSGSGGMVVGSDGSVSNAALIDLDGGSGGISLTGTGKIGSPGSGIVDLTTTGSIAEAATATVDAATLRSSGGVGGPFDLSSGSNDILNLGSIAVGGGFKLNDSGNPGTLTVTGPVTAASVAVTGTPTLTIGGSIDATAAVALDSGTIALGTGASVTGTTIDLTAASGGIALSGNAVLGNTGALVDLTTTGGGITEAATSTITASTLQSTGGVTGNVSLPGSSNAIAVLGNFTVTNGDFTLTNAEALVASGALSANNVTLSAPQISVGGSVTAANTLSLSATGSDILMNDNAVLNAPTVDLAAFSNGITEAATAQIIAGLLQAPAAVIGTVNLAGTTNAIANLGSFAVTTGSLTLIDNGSLNLTGSVNGTNVAITTLGAGQIDATADISAPGGTIALTSGTGGVTIGTGGSVANAALIDIDGGSGGISLTGTGNIGSPNSGVVDLTTTGGIAEAATATVNAATLQSTLGVTGDVTLPNATVSSIGKFTVTGGNLTLDNGSHDLALNGPISATNITFNNNGAAAITGTGPVAATGTLALNSGAGGIGLGTGAMITGATIDLNGNTGSIALTGNAKLGTSNALIDLTTTGGITEAATSAITAATLQSTLGVTGNVTLAGSNAITSLGNFAVTGGNLSLTNDAALAVGGPLSATNITLNALQITVTGNVTAANTLSLTANNSIALNGAAILNAPTVDLDAFSAGIAEATTAQIVAGLLQAPIPPEGTVNLAGTANAIAALGSFALGGGSLTLVDSISLNIIGGITGTDISITTPGAAQTNVTSDIFTSGGTIALTSGGVVVSSGGSVFGAALIDIDAGSGGINISGNGNIGSSGPGVVDLNTTGAVTEAATATLYAGVLQSSQGVTGNVLLQNAAIANLGDFTVSSGRFTLIDSVGLSVFGALTAATGTTIQDTGALSVSGSISAPSIALTAGTIDIPGLVTDGGVGTVSLIANAGSIGETGTLIAGTLTGSAIGSASLTGATPSPNMVATLGDFTASGFDLSDGRALQVTGIVNGGTSAIIQSANTLTVGGTVAASAIQLSSSNVAITGLVTDGGNGTVILSAAGGKLIETGTLIAGTLSDIAGSPEDTVNLAGATPTANRIGTLGVFTSTTSFMLNDGESLAIDGPVSGGSTVTISDAASLAIPGSLSGGMLNLTAAGVAGSGSLSFNTITGTVTGAVSLTGQNRIGTVGDFTAAGFSLNDTEGLAINGVLNGGPSATITDGGPLTVNGVVTAETISLIANSIAIPGVVTDGGAGTTNLVANAGTINETGTLIAGSLSGSATGAASFVGATPTTNQIATLSDFTASSLTLNNGVALTISDPVNAGLTATITDAAPINVAALNAGVVALIAPSMSITGSLIGTTSINLTASAGGISGSGSVGTPFLTGTAAGAVSLTGPNAITNLGNFNSPGFTFNNTTNLAINGVLNGGPNITITDAGLLTVNGVVTAETISLIANGIAIPGVVSDGGAGTTNLVADAGTINETGTLIAGSLSGSATGAASFVGATPATNQVATLSDFTASSLTLNDGTALTISDLVNGGPTTTITDAAPINVAALNAGVVALIAPSISIPGSLIGTTSINLIATAGGISGIGSVVTPLLTGSSVGAVSLTGPNAIAVLGNFNSPGFTLNNTTDLAINGVLNGGPNITITDAGLLTVNGIATANSLSLTANAIAIPGVATDGGRGATSLAATGGTIAETGTLIAGTLTGSAAGAVSLTGATPTTNQIATLGDFAAADFIVNNGPSLTVNDTLNIGSNVTIDDAALLRIVNMTGGAVTLTAPSIEITPLPTGLPLPGTLTGTTSITLTATSGYISASNSVDTPFLIGSAPGTAALSGRNMIGVLGNFTAANFNLEDDTSLTLNGRVNGGGSVVIDDVGLLTVNGVATAKEIALAAGTIAIPGMVSDGGAGTVFLLAQSGPIGETGALIAGTLIGRAAGAISLTGTTSGSSATTANQVRQLGSLTAGGFTLFDATNLTIASTLTAPKIVIDTGSNQITLADGAIIVTGGNARPPGTNVTLPTAANSPTGGAFLSAGGFTQLGTSFVTGMTGGANILRIDARGAGSITFDASHGLNAPLTWLILGVDTGTASGNVLVQALDVVRSGVSGSTSLTGTIGGLTGVAAAGAADIAPTPGSNFKFNACPIHSVTCVLLPSEAIPTANPLNDVYFGSVLNPDDQDDLLLPIVSDQDY